VGPRLGAEGANQLKRIVLAAVTASILMVSAAASAQADPHNGGGRHKSDPTCGISPNPAAVGEFYVVSATGLPILSAINLWVTDPSGNTTGSPLGSTPDGTFALNESSSSAGTWTYVFSGPTKNNMQIYATCSVTAY
jgi:hypothetical protein